MSRKFICEVDGKSLYEKDGGYSYDECDWLFPRVDKIQIKNPKIIVDTNKWEENPVITIGDSFFGVYIIAMHLDGPNYEFLSIITNEGIILVWRKYLLGEGKFLQVEIEN